MSKKDQRLGRLAGRAWADSNRSINAVEAVFKFMSRTAGCSDETELMDAMADIIGDDDEEFHDLGETKSDAYIGAWYRGVCEVAQEWKARR
jgi:hypothetical protein